ncbi:hypothetical protein PACILC2_22370 [Paenibacillus cisolokensis]|uniref:Holliday junction nuclease RuvC n=1 Tax=Paenibacillus cisolokensis TaxID=1658519 RepID=A0ABQ4N624_9BACL|nr:crossover junction endodeoxyribonuclease RuvC [Paenibacillus cisolokensis]GIQ63669.1 hypothetical protein PACILC2_22370 [Paenibacillus cisolokensis]
MKLGGGRRKTTVTKRSDTEIYAGLDLSLTSPGFAAVSVKNRKPTLVAVTHAKTSANMTDAQRRAVVKSTALLFANKYGPFDGIVREDFTSGRNKRATQTIYSAWAAVEDGLAALGYDITAHITPTTVKKTIGGSGSADKADVAAGVRRILGLAADYRFATDDESDAAAVVLAWLIREGRIDV